MAAHYSARSFPFACSIQTSQFPYKYFYTVSKIPKNTFFCQRNSQKAGFPLHKYDYVAFPLTSHSSNNNSHSLSLKSALKGMKSATGHIAEKLNTEGVALTPERDDEGGIVSEFPPTFLKFLSDNNIDPAVYKLNETIPRYIRIKSGVEVPAVLQAFTEETGCQPQPVSWLPGFYSLPPAVTIASSAAYRAGQLFGMDVASGAAVEALSIHSGDHVLDLCAAPGAKLCMIADVVGANGSVTAVDVSQPRLAACRTMLKKYKLGDSCRLFLGDGTRFSVGPPVPPNGKREFPELESGDWDAELNVKLDLGKEEVEEAEEAEEGEEEEESEGQRMSDGETIFGGSTVVLDTQIGDRNVTESSARSAVSAPDLEKCGPRRRRLSRKERRRIKSLRQYSDSGSMDEWERLGAELFFVGRTAWQWWGPPFGNPCPSHETENHAGNWGYDKVLVDAECTHDGSLKHIGKFGAWGWESLERRFLDPHRMAALEGLQRNLLSNGFRLLKKGGTLVYSTCSLTKAQNEAIVEWFLKTHNSAELQQIEDAAQWPCQQGGIEATLRFDPTSSNTSGLFVARLTKS